MKMERKRAPPPLTCKLDWPSDHLGLGVGLHFHTTNIYL